MSPIKAYTYGYEESKAETIASFWQIIENLYNEIKAYDWFDEIRNPKTDKKKMKKLDINKVAKSLNILNEGGEE